jgi:hypothetical protein
MEITIKIDGVEQSGGTGGSGAAAQPTGGSQQEPSPELAARAAALGAINAGAAHVPVGAQTGPVANVTAATDAQQQASGAAAAGAAPHPNAEPQSVAVEADGEEEQ